MAMQAQMIAQARSQALKTYNYYLDLAEQAYARFDYSAFLNNSSMALSTGFYNADLYLKRGKVFIVMNDFLAAKREFRLARKHGHPQATTALKELRKQKKRGEFTYPILLSHLRLLRFLRRPSLGRWYTISQIHLLCL